MIRLNQFLLVLTSTLVLAQCSARYEDVIIGTNVVGVVVDRNGELISILESGTHKVNERDSIVIYDISDVNLNGFLQAKFLEDTIAIIEYDLTLKFRLDSFEVLHTYYGDNYESRFLKPEINSTIRQSLIGQEINNFTQSLVRDEINTSKINNLFTLEESYFRLKSEEGYYDSLARARRAR